MYCPTNIRTFAITRETSREIALAIFELAAEGDEARMWAEPSPEEHARVIARAWKLAEPETSVLHWGNERLMRGAEA